MTEENWHQARLIPTSGISGAEEQERRATSALLAVMGTVKEFSKAILAPLGAPSGNVETYIEVPFVLGEKKCYPDGLIRVTRGSKTWTALVEVKTGRNQLETEQLESYLDIAREQGFDVLLTISNEIPPVAGQHPTKVDKRKLKKVSIHHRSWTAILSTAVMQKDHKGVSDPEQAWILGELIRYLEHPRSGAMELEDMGANWVSVRQAVTAGTLRSTDRPLRKWSLGSTRSCATPPYVSAGSSAPMWCMCSAARNLPTQLAGRVLTRRAGEPGRAGRCHPHPQHGRTHPRDSRSARRTDYLSRGHRRA
ncbi:hypothetical protein [Nocardioides massiliensis]|uniref:Uncharacterized protein n=1 Tax=Nocardioides massiliensis TaxID=1325935 RepID=A0ABT9NQT7_9ACTN|nr:hypothetical protein [Nocardioides massiliensis]MDP9822676.1 hypothetical protein [Nocardioides massiliensis]